VRSIYIFSGLGTDDRVFQNIDLSGFQYSFIEWIPPFRNEELASYCKRLSKQIKTCKPTLIGLSFGGIIAVEVAKFIETESIILIASVKTREEIPFYYRLAGFFRLHTLVPTSFLLSPTVFVAWVFGVSTKKDKQLLTEILNSTDPAFLKWAINEIVCWRNKARHYNLTHIHGMSDRILPRIFVKPDIVIPNGGHFMTVNKALEVTNTIRSLLEDNSTMEALMKFGELPDEMKYPDQEESSQ